MFKVGDRVVVKSYDECLKIASKLKMGHVPDSYKCYCGKFGIIKFIEESKPTRRQMIQLDITDDFLWWDCELVHFQENGFIPLSSFIVEPRKNLIILTEVDTPNYGNTAGF